MGKCCPGAAGVCTAAPLGCAASLVNTPSRGSPRESCSLVSLLEFWENHLQTQIKLDPVPHLPNPACECPASLRAAPALSWQSKPSQDACPSNERGPWLLHGFYAPRPLFCLFLSGEGARSVASWLRRGEIGSSRDICTDFGLSGSAWRWEHAGGTRGFGANVNS